MGGFGSSSLSGPNDWILRLPTLPHILILLHLYVVGGVSISTGNGLNLTAVEKVYHVNDTIWINCSLNDSSRTTNVTDITWTFNGEVLDETSSQLVVENAQFEDSGVYGCKLDWHSQQEDVRWDIKVGLPPTEATIIKCDSYDFVTFNCSWKNGRPTNIETTHVLQYCMAYFGEDVSECHRNQKCDNPRTLTNLLLRVKSSNALAVDGVHSKTVRFRIKDHMTVTPVRSANVTNATSTSFQVSWFPPVECPDYPLSEKHYMQYTVRYKLQNAQDWHNETVGASRCSRFVFPIRGLKANSVYSINIGVMWQQPTTVLPSQQVSLLGRTKEIAPESGVDLKFLCTRIGGTNEANLSWSLFPEDKSNGKILSYDIIVKKENSSVITMDPNVTKHRLRGVDLFHDYNLTIVARNSAGSSDVDNCYIPALPRADPAAVVTAVLIIVGAVLFVVIFILGFKLYICFKKSKIPEIKLPHHIQNDNFYLYGSPQRRAPCEEERYDELITQSFVENGVTSCNSTMPDGKKDPSREPIMAEPTTTEVPLN